MYSHTMTGDVESRKKQQSDIRFRAEDGVMSVDASGMYIRQTRRRDCSDNNNE